MTVWLQLQQGLTSVYVPQEPVMNAESDLL